LKRLLHSARIKLLCILTILIFISFAMQIITIKSASETEVRVEPFSSFADPDNNFTINIHLMNIQNLYGVEVRLLWNASLLRLIRANVTLGVQSYPQGILNEPVEVFYNKIDNDIGEYLLVATSTSPAEPFNGNGNIVTLTFIVTNQGSCILTLKTKLADWPPPDRQPRVSWPIPHTTIGGFFSSNSEGINLDDTPPITLDDYNGLWHTEDFIITLTATDDLSGVAEIYYEVNNGPTKTVNYDGQPYITTEGFNNTLEYWSIDKAGNEEPHKILTEIKLDKTRPVANAGQNQTINVGETVTFDASNSTDNIGIISYKWDFGDGATATGVTVTHAYTNPGTYTVKLTVMDKAGNIGIDSVRVIVTTSDIVPAWIKSILIVAGITFILLIVVILRKR